jgi:hypothetical protein
MISFLSAYACIVAFLPVFYSFLGILTPTCRGYQPGVATISVCAKPWQIVAIGEKQIPDQLS